MKFAKILVHLCISMAIAAAITAGLVFAGVIKPRARALPEYGQVAEFTFTERSGKPLGRKDLEGKVWIADFFFTSCRGPCPTMTATMAQVQADLADVPDVRSVSFSLDGERDTPSVLTGYADAYHASKDRWLFVTAPHEEVVALANKTFKNPAGKEGGEVYHGTYFFLVDRRGTVRGHYNINDDGVEARARLVKDARILAAEGATP